MLPGASRRDLCWIFRLRDKVPAIPFLPVVIPDFYALLGVVAFAATTLELLYASGGCFLVSLAFSQIVLPSCLLVLYGIFLLPYFPASCFHLLLSIAFSLVFDESMLALVKQNRSFGLQLTLLSFSIRAALLLTGSLFVASPFIGADFVRICNSVTLV
jgi:hypothetical protein